MWVSSVFAVSLSCIFSCGTGYPNFSTHCRGIYQLRKIPWKVWCALKFIFIVPCHYVFLIVYTECLPSKCRFISDLEAVFNYGAKYFILHWAILFILWLVVIPKASNHFCSHYAGSWQLTSWRKQQFRDSHVLFSDSQKQGETCIHRWIMLFLTI